jgi:UDP-N-acetyl-2-amino-2-deoxyglucuronate dehydrogenase
MTRPLRTALVGCGKVGSIHARALGELPESDFVAACDASLDRAENLAVPWCARPFTDLARCSRPRGPRS